MSLSKSEREKALDNLESALTRFVERRKLRLEKEKAFLTVVRNNQTISRANSRSKNVDSIKGLTYARLVGR